MKTLRYILWLLCLPVCLCAQQTTVEGLLPGWPGGTVVEAWAASDYLSWHKTRLDSTQTDEKGHFSLSFPLRDTAKILLSAHQVWVVYLEPGQNLALSLVDSSRLPALLSPTACTHQHVLDLESQRQFIHLQHQDKNPASQWAGIWRDLCAAYQHSQQSSPGFFQTYARYYLGYQLVEAASRLHDQSRVDSLERALLFGQPPLFQHPEYLNFISTMTLNRLTVAAFQHFPAKDKLPLELLKRELRWYPDPVLQELVTLAGYKLCLQYNWVASLPSALAELEELGQSLKNPHTQLILGHLIDRYRPAQEKK